MGERMGWVVAVLGAVALALLAVWAWRRSGLTWPNYAAAERGEAQQVPVEGGEVSGYGEVDQGG